MPLKLWPTIQFPLQKGIKGFFSEVYDIEAVKVSIRVLLLTRLGERVFLSDFGSRIHELVFEPIVPAFNSLFEAYVQDAIEKWEPRAVLTRVTINQYPNQNEVQISLEFALVRPGEESFSLNLTLDRQSGVFT